MVILLADLGGRDVQGKENGVGNRDGDAFRGQADIDVLRAESLQVDAGFQIGRAAEEDLPVPDLVPGAFVVGLYDLADAVFDEAELFHRGNGLDFPRHRLLHGGTAGTSRQRQDRNPDAKKQDRSGMNASLHLPQRYKEFSIYSGS